MNDLPRGLYESRSRRVRNGVVTYQPFIGTTIIIDKIRRITKTCHYGKRHTRDFAIKRMIIARDRLKKMP